VQLAGRTTRYTVPGVPANDFRILYPMITLEVEGLRGKGLRSKADDREAGLLVERRGDHQAETWSKRCQRNIKIVSNWSRSLEWWEYSLLES
jgi:hypothetical protein